MNDKFSIQDLVDALTARHDMNPSDADAFVKLFFALIEEALATEKYIKIKGLGTFKLIDVDRRESVDVNTGDRIEIQEHSRIVFTPEQSMRDVVNKPFAHFETVLLHEGVRFADMPEDDLSETPDSPEEEEPSDEQRELETSAPEEPAINTEIPVTAQPEEPEPTPVIPPHTEEPESEEQHRFRLPWCMIAAVLLVGILLGGGAAWLLLSGRRYIPEDLWNEMMEKHASQVAVVDTLRKDSVPQQQEIRPDSVENITVGTAQPESLSDTVEYQITGTLASHTIKPGESLVKVSLKYYGTKQLWPYIARHNRKILKDADNVPVGTTIEVPQLKPKVQ